jgi:hypothetical protein
MLHQVPLSPSPSFKILENFAAKTKFQKSTFARTKLAEEIRKFYKKILNEAVFSSIRAELSLPSVGLADTSSTQTTGSSRQNWNSQKSTKMEHYCSLYFLT